MKAYSMQNKKAWEYNAYEFWVKQAGTPADRAKQDREDPVGMLKKYADYFDTYSGRKLRTYAVLWKEGGSAGCFGSGCHGL